MHVADDMRKTRIVEMYIVIEPDPSRTRALELN